MTRSERFDQINRGRYEKPEVPLCRFLVRVSFEDASDVSDWWETHDGLHDACNVYRALEVWDLDSQASWYIEWTNTAIRRPEPVPYYHVLPVEEPTSSPVNPDSPFGV